MSTPINKSKLEIIGDPTLENTSKTPSATQGKVAAVQKRKAEEQEEPTSVKRLLPTSIIGALHDQHAKAVARLIDEAHKGKDADLISFSMLLNTLLTSEETVQLQDDAVPSVNVASHVLEKKDLKAKIKAIVHAQLKPTTMWGGFINPVSQVAVKATWAIINVKLTEKYKQEFESNPEAFNERVVALCEKHEFNLSQVQALIKDNNWQALMDVLFPS
jgi:hypothetical protein